MTSQGQTSQHHVLFVIRYLLLLMSIERYRRTAEVLKANPLAITYLN